MNNINEVIAQMTLDEKASLCAGVDFWHLQGINRLGIPSIMLADGPHGLRKKAGDTAENGLSDSVPSTCFPTASALAATWNSELIFEVGQAIAKECKEEKVGVILGPGANIKRSPLCGRNFEYFSEDPHLSGEIAKTYIQGVQSLGVGTALKHYAANNQEHRRLTIDAVVDERALREIYLAGFEIAVKGAQPWMLMCAYNKLNGSYLCEHTNLLSNILNDEWGHKGTVVSDWGAVNDRVKGLAAGLDIEMPGSKNGNEARIAKAICEGELDEAVLDRAVERILALIFNAEETLSEDFTYDRQAHHYLARRVAGEGAVLLKNEAETLPLKKDINIALIGEFAKSPRYQGAGSSLVNPLQLENIHDEIVKIVGDSNVIFAPGYSNNGMHADKTLIEEALAAADQAEIIVICVGLPDSFEEEGFDRQHMKLPASHNDLIRAIAGIHSNVLVVLNNGSPVEMPWIDEVQAVLEGYLGGQAGAGAIADILFGLVNPSGKLAETFPLKLEDNSSFSNFPGGPRTVEYRESIYVGYRFYDAVGKDVLFPFGYGLSYTIFEYRDLKLDQAKISDKDTLAASLIVKNTGDVAGMEIVQFYVGTPESRVFRAKKELKRFTKVFLQPGEEKEVKVVFDPRAFAYYNISIKEWHVESGLYEILVGSSSRDLHLRGEVQIESTLTVFSIGEGDQLLAYKNFPADARIGKNDFENLLGRALPSNRIPGKGSYTLNTSFGDIQDSFIGRQLGNQMVKQMASLIINDSNRDMAQVTQLRVKDMPLRALLMRSEDLSREMLEALLLILNGHFFPGLLAFGKAIIKKKWPGK